MKVHTNLSVEGDLLETAKKKGFNISNILENALGDAINLKKPEKKEEEELKPFVDENFNIEEIKWLRNHLRADTLYVWKIFKTLFKRGGSTDLENYAKKKIELLDAYPDKRIESIQTPTYSNQTEEKEL